jgi:molybdopterin molybdotransferase
MVTRGTRVTHATVAIAAAIGRPEVAVYKRPRVAVLATGDEVVDINLPPGPNEIRNSNSYSLAAQVSAAGGDAMILPVAPDDAGELALLLRKGLDADLLLVTGGVSMGKYDLVEQVLASFQARIFFTGARIQPGKPVVFGEVTLGQKTTPFFGLPGNPVSTMVTFQLFARPLLDALAGAKPQPLPFAQAWLKSDFATKTGLTRFLPAKLSGTNCRPEVELVRWQGSGDLMAVSQSNCYIVVPPDREKFAAGDAITILPF